MKKLYLDIDGVLLNNRSSRPADYSEAFVDFILKNFDCYWLTTHCKGNSESALRYLRSYFDQVVIEKLKNVKPTNWDTLKTEAIDFTSEFIWLEDFPFQSEIEELKRNDCFNSLIKVDLLNENELESIERYLQPTPC